jgi:subtilisin family serine protease
MMRSGKLAGTVVSVLAAMACAAPAMAQPSFDPLPMKLPAEGARAADTSEPGTWLLGIRPSPQAKEIAARFSGELIGDRILRIDTSRARDAAAALKAAGGLLYAEPDVRRQPASAYDGYPEQWGRGAIVHPSLPAPGPSVRVGVIDDLVDVTHPDVAAHTTPFSPGPIGGPHGTMVASVISGALGNGGVMGVFPSVPILSWPSDLSCGSITDGIYELKRFGAKVINMSYGSPGQCVSENIAIQQAIGEGVIIVAAAGNDFEEGNLPQFPAAYPHVLSVAATNIEGGSAWFSNANFAIDVSAPGVGVPVAVPVAYDVEDGVRDGTTFANGTSFAAPMVAGAAAWLAVARPALDGTQLADVIRYSSRDLGRSGWDPDFGYGIIDIGAALDEPAPLRDPFEPNDDMPYINGTYFKGGDPRIYSGRSRAIGASVDIVEDPYDVYRFRMPGRSALVAKLRPRFGDADLIAYHDGAKSLRNRRAIVDSSFRSRGTDQVDLINTSRRAVEGYFVVSSAERNGSLGARYSLRITRTPYRR